MTLGKQAVLDAVNDLEQYRHDPAMKSCYEQALRERIAEYENSSADGVPDCQWHLAVMKAMAANALGNIDEAITYDQESLKYAFSEEHRAVSCNNLSDGYRRVGRFADAESEGRKAYALWPSHGGIICNLALALAKNGKRLEATKILAALIESSDLDNPRDIVAAHVRYEEELQELLPLLAEEFDQEKGTDDEREAPVTGN
jgi:tetratricopeptide (TPR) repeat protein